MPECGSASRVAAATLAEGPEPMRHITPENLDRLSSMLADLRKIHGLQEKKTGVFYRKSKAFLHFHEDPKGLFADLRLAGADFDRFDVTSRADQRALVARIRAALPGEDLEKDAKAKKRGRSRS